MNYSSLNLKAISFVLYPSASVPSNLLVPRVLPNSSARIERNEILVEEDLRNEVEAKYTFLNWPIDQIDLLTLRSILPSTSSFLLLILSIISYWYYFICATS